MHSGFFFGEVRFDQKIRILKELSTYCDSESSAEMHEYVVERNNYDLRFWVNETKGEVVSEKLWFGALMTQVLSFQHLIVMKE